MTSYQLRLKQALTKYVQFVNVVLLKIIYYHKAVFLFQLDFVNSVFFYRMRCTLYGFITDYVKDIFIEEILFDIREKLREVTLGEMLFKSCHLDIMQ